MKKFLLLIIFLLSEIYFGQWSISSAERIALVSIYNSTDGNHWSQQWDLNQDPRFWYGIKVSNGSVTGINLRGNNLKGNFPDCSVFGKLQNLDLSSNHLTGEVSPTISSLATLKRIDISKNNLSGDPSAILSPLSQLTELSLGDNGFSIPNINGLLQNFTNLTVLDIAGLSLIAVPQKITTISGLKSLNISNNALTAGFENLSSLTNLEELHLSNNQLTKIPAEIAPLSKLKILEVSKNPITNFTTLTSLTNLEWLSLEDNQINTIPGEISSLTKMIHLNLNRNSISTGFSTITQLANLEQLFLDHNKIEGNFPSELLGISALQMISLNSNNLSGEIPSNVPAITLLANNRYTLSQIKNYLDEKNSITEIDYSPQRYDSEVTINATIGSDVSLPQSLSSSGNYQFSWFKNLDENLFVSNENYHINGVKNEDFTKYTCEAYYVNDFTDYILEASFYREPITLANEALSTEEVSKGFYIYPNPTSDYLNIRTENIKVEESYIYDMSGKLVKTVKGNKINVASFPTGSYLLVVKTDSGIKKFKFIKK